MSDPTGKEIKGGKRSTKMNEFDDFICRIVFCSTPEFLNQCW